MSADASWPCFAHETGLNSNMQGSLSTKVSKVITLDLGSFPVVIVSTFRSINTNNTPHCLFWEPILHTNTLLITTKPLVVRNGDTADTRIPATCQQSTVQWAQFSLHRCTDLFLEKTILMSKAYCHRCEFLFKNTLSPIPTYIWVFFSLINLYCVLYF